MPHRYLKKDHFRPSAFRESYVDKMFNKDDDSVRSILKSNERADMSMSRGFTSEERAFISGGAGSVLPAAPSANTMRSIVEQRNVERANIMKYGVAKKNFQQVMGIRHPIRGDAFDVAVDFARNEALAKAKNAKHLSALAHVWGS
eukprot:PhM_4_TR37/c0_g2_i1/m.34704